MSHEYGASLVIGYAIPVEDFFKGMVVHQKETSHTEPRYDPITGKKTEGVKIVDRPESNKIICLEQEFEGPEDLEDLDCFDPDNDLMEAIGEALDCEASVTGDHYNGGNFFVCLSSSKADPAKDVVPMKDVAKNIKDLERIGKAVKRLFKVDPGVCGVHSVMWGC